MMFTTDIRHMCECESMYCTLYMYCIKWMEPKWNTATTKTLAVTKVLANKECY